MRLRFEALAPLPATARGWLPAADDSTILLLRQQLQRVFSLPSEIVLELLGAFLLPSDTSVRAEQATDFPLLDSTVVKDVLQANDLVHIRLKTGSNVLSKPPATVQAASGDSSDSSSDDSSDSGPDLQPTRPPSALNPALPTSQAKRSRTSSDTSSSSSDSSDSSSSESDSDTDEEAGTSNTQPLAPANLPPTVPPGQGKSRTRARNARKRKKLAAEKERALQEVVVHSTPKAAAQAVIETPAPVATPNPDISMATQGSRDDSLTMFSQSNKNKRKGYKKDLMQSKAATAYADLPLNLVISRVNVRADGWEPGQRTVVAGDFSTSAQREQPNGITAETRWSTLAAANRSFELSPPVDNPADLAEGTAMAIKVLELDSSTLSPMPRLYWGILLALVVETKPALHLLPTDLNSSEVPTETRHSLRLKLHTACMASMVVEEEEEYDDEELSTRESNRQARRREVLQAALAENGAQADEKVVEWSQVVEARLCT